VRCKGRWKCGLCGALTNVPPVYPTPVDWLPVDYEKLTEEERELAGPYVPR
jgi:hypothetical protein